ncbi:MAG: ThuA domain-containing protein [Bryobacterales bacterium]
MLFALLAPGMLAAADAQWVVYEGGAGPGSGKHIVLISGDEEYRSEEALPQLGKILATHHGFKCTVLFAIDPADGTINPEKVDNIPGLEALETAELMIIATRFRELPDQQMKFVDEYIHSGRPVIGLRTATHSFRFPADSTSAYKHFSFDSKTWEGGFGKQVLGETWISHHGRHAIQSTRGVLATEAANHPILRGVEDIWGPTDVYTVALPTGPNFHPLVMGQVLEGMSPDDAPVGVDVRKNRAGVETRMTPNQPMMPVAWTRSFTGRSGKTSRVFTTTMGSSVDLDNEGLRRMLVNAAYWCLDLEAESPAKAKVDLVGPYRPTPFGFGKHTPGTKPADHAM